MRQLTIPMICCCLTAGCSQRIMQSEADRAAAMQMQAPIVITRSEQLDAAVGKVVTLQGEVTNTKIPTLLGVDVASHSPDLRGQLAKATGILQKWTETKKQWDNYAAKGMIPQGRGPGTFYRLVQIGSEQEVQVQPLP